jgi:hypothetical protein
LFEKPGCDNSHKGTAIRAPFTSVGARFIFLPFHFFAALLARLQSKSNRLLASSDRLRKAQARTSEIVVQEIAATLPSFSATECATSGSGKGVNDKMIAPERQARHLTVVCVSGWAGFDPAPTSSVRAEPFGLLELVVAGRTLEAANLRYLTAVGGGLLLKLGRKSIMAQLVLIRPRRPSITRSLVAKRRLTAAEVIAL